MSQLKTKRKKWHSNKALTSALEELRKQAKKKLGIAVESESSFADISVYIIRNCDLRATLQEKALSTNDHAKWTCFVNRAGTLLHIVPREGDGHWRQPLFYSINHCNDKHVERLVQQYMCGRFV